MNDTLDNALNSDQSSVCPCGSGKALLRCCRPYIEDAGLDAAKIPVTAELLMRSRYTAYVLQNADYILRTWHADTRPGNIDFSGVDSVQWTALEIVATTRGQADDDRGSVEFIATYQVEGVEKQLHENSRFVKQYGRWFYVDGKIKRNLNNATGGDMKKTGRNETCPCGSGKKYKKCCM